jgi:NADPH:quinone reductase-like Zn-dependent oxidoreductase
MRHQRVVISHYGGPDALQLVEEDAPQPRPGEVRVKVLAAGVAMPDVMAREGIHPETPKVPYTPGWDLVGVVDALGDGAADLDVGQFVAAMPISGCYAGYVCLKSQELVRVPEGLDPAETVCLVLNYITAYQMLHYSAAARPGQSILIHGASGGVGTALLQLGRLLGLTMYGTCSSRGAQTVMDLGGTRKSSVCPVAVSTPSSIHLADRTCGNLVRYSVGEAEWWHTAQQHRYERRG